MAVMETFFRSAKSAKTTIHQCFPVLVVLIVAHIAALRLMQNVGRAAKESCQAVWSEKMVLNNNGTKLCKLLKYTPENAAECIRSLFPAEASGETSLVYFEGDSRMYYIMEHLAYNFLKAFPRTVILKDYSDRNPPGWHLRFSGFKFSSINLELIWRRARMINHTILSNEVQEVMQDYLGNRTPILSIYNLALDVQYINRTEAPFGPEIQERFRMFAENSFINLAARKKVVWFDGPPVVNSVFNSRILSLNEKQRKILARNFPDVITWPGMWHQFETVLQKIGNKKFYAPDFVHLGSVPNEMCNQVLLNILCNEYYAEKANDEYLCCSSLKLRTGNSIILPVALIAGVLFVIMFFFLTLSRIP